MGSTGAGIVLVIGVIALIVIIRLAGGADHGRIRAYVAQRGGTVQSIEWNPLGRGWFGEQNDRIYRVIYIDPEGNTREASCKTSLFSGVYFTEDRILTPSRKSRERESQTDDLRAENERLREELRRLREKT